jgi:hypothetical protein
MRFIKGKIWLAVIALAVVSFALGATFIAQGVTKAAWMSDAMRLEAVTLGLDEGEVASGNVIDTAAEAQSAGDTIREHRRGIAPTYNDLLEGGRFNASDTEQLTYAQALNMENYLYLAVLGFGVTQMAIGMGVFMLVVAIALGAIGILLRHRAS